MIKLSLRNFNLQNFFTCFTEKPSWELSLNNGMDMGFSLDKIEQQYSGHFEDTQPLNVAKTARLI
jgi:hypothetical protein